MSRNSPGPDPEAELSPPKPLKELRPDTDNWMLFNYRPHGPDFYLNRPAGGNPNHLTYHSQDRRKS
jgi:hypothetical protein